VSQKLAPVQRWINERAQAPHDRVHISTMYEAATITKNSQRTGGFTKGRWAVTAVPLERAGAKLAQFQPSFERAIVLAAPGHVSVC
jgi:hypothetical protein